MELDITAVTACGIVVLLELVRYRKSRHETQGGGAWLTLEACMTLVGAMRRHFE